MIHTYRDEQFLSSRFLHQALLGLLLLIGGFLSWTIFPTGLSLVGVGFAGLVVAIFCLLQYAAYRHEQYRRCGEIRLGDDGTCELETKRRVIRLHVNEIRSVQYKPESDETTAYYMIRYQGGKVFVANEMARMADFAARLKTLNPGVDVSTVPTVRTDATEQSGLANDVVQSALFPLFVICLVVWLVTGAPR